MKYLLLLALAMPCAAAPAAIDVLDRAARTSDIAQQRLITSVAHAGDRVVAAGQRGHVLFSDDGGRQWTQAQVPVSSDLTAVFFPTPAVGYAVGHDGVVLGSRDAGATWSRLLDGRQANDLVLAHMRARAAADDASDDDRILLQEAERNAGLGPDKPFLDVWFENEDEGFVVGAYNLIFRTADGGRNWEPWFDRTDNPGLLNLYAIRGLRGAFYVAGEGGLLLKLDAGGQRFSALPSPYGGSYFGLLATGRGVLAYGMRGNAFLSEDGGRQWTAVDTGLSASIVGGDIAADGRLVLVDQGGGVAVSDEGGAGFRRAGLERLMPLAAVATTPAGLVLAGPRGLRAVDLAGERP